MCLVCLWGRGHRSIIGGNAPSIYLKYLEENHNISTANLDDCIESHIIDIDALRADDFQAFFEQRKDSLVVKIEKAMKQYLA